MPYLNQGLRRGVILLTLLVAAVVGAATGPLATARAATPTPGHIWREC